MEFKKRKKHVSEMRENEKMRTFEQCFASVPHAFEKLFAPQLLHQD